jgi:hypothetical protein
VSYKQRFGDDGTSASRSNQAGNRYDKVYEKNGEVTCHRIIVANSKDMTRLGNLSNLWQELGIRTQQAAFGQKRPLGRPDFAVA